MSDPSRCRFTRRCTDAAVPKLGGTCTGYAVQQKLELAGGLSPVFRYAFAVWLSADGRRRRCQAAPVMHAAMATTSPQPWSRQGSVPRVELRSRLVVPAHHVRPFVCLRLEDATRTVLDAPTASFTPGAVERLSVLGWQTPESGAAFTPLPPEGVVIHRLGT